MIALIVPMMLLMWGPFLIFGTWNYQRVDFTSAGPATQSLPPEPWSPTGATSGEIWWYTYDPASAAEVNNVPVEVALCPTGTTAIDPGLCRPATGVSFTALNYGDSSVSIPAGWHVVAKLNVTEICTGCHTSVRFGSGEIGLGSVLFLAGVAVLVPSLVIWLRTRAKVRSAWPE